MGWMQKCLETYENNRHLVGEVREGQYPLAPVGFTVQGAQLEVTLDENGSFVDAVSIPKEAAKTLIPVTEQSAVRSSGVAAHPLCDQLGYCALGHPDVPGGEKYRKKYEVYLTGLRAWAESPASHWIVRVVYRYCLAGTMVEDLCQCGLLVCDERGVCTAGKVEGTPYEKCLVRWRVLKPGETGGESWRDRSLFAAYADYLAFQAQGEREDVCYVTGRKQATARSHPKGTLSYCYGAKLVSANDSSGFTFLGRFVNGNEALNVGFETTQKAHSALSWLAANQGLFLGGRTFLCWNPQGKPTPKGGVRLFATREEESAEPAYTMPEYRQKLSEALRGYRLNLGERADVILIALDAATTGRLSVTYYNELSASDFLRRLENWYATCCWWIRRFVKGEPPATIVATPTVEQIVNFAWGTQQGDFVRADDRIVKEHAQRLLHCIADGQAVPADIVRALVRRAALRQAYHPASYETLLFVACAMIRKLKNDQQQREVWKMELDLENRDRSYLFGRLLAVLEKVERATYSVVEIDREPNACRLQAVFVQRPMETWAVLEKALRPYYDKLSTASERYYKDLIGTLVELLEEQPEALNRPLQETYLLGYYLQRKELNRSHKSTNQIHSVEEK